MSGFFGVISGNNCVNEVFYGTDYHSHLGTRRAGLVFNLAGKGFWRSIHNIENAYFRNKFESELAGLESNSGIGIISDTDPQPLVFNSHLGRFAIVTVSRLVNIFDLEKYFLDKKEHFTEHFEGNINPTEIVSKLICEKNDFVEGIENVFGRIKGSCSLLILTENGIIAARDKLGRTPVVIGKREGAFAVATESSSFANTGFSTEYFLGPSEIVLITAEGITQLKKPAEKMQICAFLWVYFGYPPSYYEGINVEECRNRCGAALAKRDKTEADFVCGIPDSGIGHAVGYSNEKKLPYKRAYSKYTPTWPRSFMPQDQNQRDLVAKMKLITNDQIIRDKKIIFLDDSIVRGTQLKECTEELRKSGAKEVHMRIACPPLLYPCIFLNFSQSRSIYELAGRKAIRQLGGEDKDIAEYSDPDSEKYRKMVDCITQNLGLDSLLYQRLDDLVEAIGLPREKLCMHCWDGSGYF
ncbi:MAG TPA: amidophosphoribosyltransferase [Bacteroidales bacterium]|nr:amidophosphoribosyltransferase [Bacteroidales bacterium]HQG55752.1 amidophosphoribosyltransferase [Bacteroidales bacterium]HRR92350.1 amidophosphoribosyltransferase [Bacteroidales bacterium]HRT88502.1 amidophosphoribosyltransferase [Bacteroidales bacterium]